MKAKKPKASSPLSIFDSLEFIGKQSDFDYLGSQYNYGDIQYALAFLKAYAGSQGTFNAYRREIERLIHWCVLVSFKNLKTLKREDIENYLYFCQRPPKTWIGKTKPPRFIEKKGQRVPNPAWRPFTATVSKAERRQGLEPNKNNFDLSSTSLRELFAILSSFFSYLVQENYINSNPIATLRQKSKFIKKQQGTIRIRRLSELQWDYVIHTAKEMAEENSVAHERTFFIMSILYSLYLRISEVVASERWSPQMNHFHRDNDNNWWFTTVGKGHKERQIAVSDSTLQALKRWRKYLKLSPLPSPADDSPLLPKTKGHGPISSTNYVRRIVQACFDEAIQKMRQDGFSDEAETLNEATVHWLRHTGISDDVKIRPRVLSILGTHHVNANDLL